MADVSCPQCGNPQLDVDAENSVVYCKNCGFAVRVDPQTGEAVPISGGAGGGGGAGGYGGGAGGPPGYATGQGAPAGGAGYAPMQKSIFGTDPFTFLIGATIVLLILTYYFSLGGTIFAVMASLLLAYYLMNR